ncbi:site-specific recombinase XerD [Rhizobium sp. SJZ105]|uniref:tyrosine-type recombinase/integrase n=1 Tax=Rhizobium sp. SJZ105 TaxID=2572678 RepID=UPI0011A252C8|nr:tyrosine-type recombinase/integrase [Rhizobium sp. SJZ105]TWC78218.1 site-specific recombinase XerD [Rhizobium sp. SJZ105]
MSTLSQELDRYLAVRRGLGFELRTDERILRRFIEHAEKMGTEYVSAEVFIGWRESFGVASQQTWSRRLGIVRIFAQWLHSIDPQHQVPSSDLIPSRHRRSRPYIYKPEEIRAIIEAAAALPSTNGIRPLTYAVLFGLIAVTGLRISEAISLDSGDVDLENGVLTLRKGKLGKARLIPVSRCTALQLAAYAKERDRLLERRSRPFFVADHGERVGDCGVRYNFALVCQTLGLRARQRFHKHGRGPRIHDLRHTFAVRTMLIWYRSGMDVTREMIKLTTYLGHVSPEHTYWYIEAVPELLALASARAERALALEGSL